MLAVMMNDINYLLFVGRLDVAKRYNSDENCNNPYVCNIAPRLD